MNADELAAIEDRHEAATNGDRRWIASPDGREVRSVLADAEFSRQVALTHHAADAEFIAHARDDVPALIAAVRALLAERGLAGGDLLHEHSWDC